MKMTPDQAFAAVEKRFPFQGYMQANNAPYHTVARYVGEYLKPGDKLFDLGSGPCDKTAIAQIMGINCTAVDDLQDEWHLRGDNVATIERFAADMGISFSRSFRPPEEETYDMIMMNDVLEHIHDSPRELLNHLITGLKTGGLFFTYVPNLANIRKRIDLLRGRTNLPRYDLYYWYRSTWRGPQREYVRGDLVSMCENLGVQIIEISTVHHMMQNLTSSLRPAYRLATSVFPDWRDTWVLVARKPAGWQPRNALTDEEFARIYDKVNKEGLYG